MCLGICNATVGVFVFAVALGSGCFLVGRVTAALFSSAEFSRLLLVGLSVTHSDMTLLEVVRKSLTSFCPLLQKEKKPFNSGTF